MQVFQIALDCFFSSISSEAGEHFRNIGKTAGGTKTAESKGQFELSLDLRIGLVQIRLTDY
jgi:hypothetical protein